MVVGIEIIARRPFLGRRRRGRATTTEREGRTEWNWYRDDDGARGTTTERDRETKWGGMRSESVREWEWETERDWEWEGMRETVCFESFEFWDRLFEFLVRSVVKSSPTELILTYKNRVYWTRFSYIETESVELGFFVRKSSSTNSISGLMWTFCPTQILVK